MRVLSLVVFFLAGCLVTYLCEIDCDIGPVGDGVGVEFHGEVDTIISGGTEVDSVPHIPWTEGWGVIIDMSDYYSGDSI